MKYWGVLLATVLMVSGTGNRVFAEPVKTEPFRPGPIKPHPDLRSGKLANGLRYMLMRNDHADDGTSIRFIVKVGTYHETDDERESAHFIEHLGFRSNGNFPNELPQNFFAPLGVSFGSDLSAFTLVNETNYALDLPKTASGKTDRALDWLRGVADGITFAPSELETERGVLMSERESRNTPIASANAEIARFQSPNLRSFNRVSYASREAIARLTAGTLRSFYDRWYRPESATLIIVGSQSTDDLQALVEQKFGSWRGKGPAGVGPPPVKPATPRGVEGFSRSGKGLLDAVSACRIAAQGANIGDESARNKEKLLSSFWLEILNARLVRLSGEPANQIVSASMAVQDGFQDGRAVCLVVVPIAGNGLNAMSLAQAEFRRFEADGPTQQELEEVVDNRRGIFRGQITSDKTVGSNLLAGSMIESVQSDKTYTSPRQGLRDFNLAVETTTPGDVKAKFATDWAGDGPLISASGETTPLPAELVAAWNTGRSASALATYVDKKAKPWPYDKFGETGKVLSEQSFADPDFTRIRFANGTILNFKQTSFQAGKAAVTVLFGYGREEIANRDGFAALLGSELFVAGGLGKLSHEEIGPAFANTDTSLAFAISPHDFRLQANLFASGLDDRFQIMAAFLTDPGFRRDNDGKIPTLMNFAYGQVEASSRLSAANAIDQFYRPDGFATLPKKSASVALSSAAFERILKPSITQSPLEVTVVGDVAKEDVIEAVAATLGALPMRTRPGPVAGLHMFSHFPATLAEPLTSTHSGQNDQASASFLWPLFVATPERRKEEHALKILSTIFRDRLLSRLRVVLGKTYAPDVAMESPDNADQAVIAASVDAKPSDIDVLVETTKAMALELARGTVTAAELEAARAPSLSALQSSRTANAYWASILSASSRSNDGIEEHRNYEKLMRSVTVEDVNKAAATWFSRPPAISIAKPEKGPAK